MKWAPADVAQLTYLRTTNATPADMAETLGRTVGQVLYQIRALQKRDRLARRFRALRISEGRRSGLAERMGIPVSSLPDYRLLRSKGFSAADAADTVRSWAA